MNGEAYNPAAEANKMTEVTDGVYEITYTDVERWDNYQFKFTANGEWNPSWGADEDDAAEVDFLEMKQGGQNMILDLTKYIQEGEKATVKLVADLRNMDAKTHDGAVVRVYVNGKQINAMKTTTAVDGKKFTVIGKNLSGKTVILALYDADGRLRFTARYTAAKALPLRQRQIIPTAR